MARARSSLRPWLPHIAAAVFIVLAAVVMLALRSQAARVDALTAGGQARDRAIAALASGDSQLRSQVKRLGGTPAVPPPQVIISGVAGAQGIQGPGPSDAQVASAVAAYLTAHPVPGVSASQVAAAVSAYLAASPPPSGPAGPGPSDQQVASAVAAYMAANPAPSGPPGAAGKDGANGSPPAGWAFEANGVTYNCVPDGGTPAPHYTCPPQPSPSASPSATVSPSASGSPSPTAGPIASPADSITPPASPQPSPTVTMSAFLQPLASTRPGAPSPSGPRSGLLLLAPSYLPLSRRTA